MSEAKPTPGPWSVWNFSDSQIDVAIGPEAGGVAVAQIVTTNAHGIATDQTMATGQANAALLAAAPELLEALLVAHKRITEDRASYVWGAELPDGSMDTKDAAILHEAYDSKLAQIEAAIAKATAHKEGQ